MFQADKRPYTRVVCLKRDCIVLAVLNQLVHYHQKHHISNEIYLFYLFSFDFFTSEYTWGTGMKCNNELAFALCCETQKSLAEGLLNRT